MVDGNNGGQGTEPQARRPGDALPPAPPPGRPTQPDGQVPGQVPGQAPQQPAGHVPGQPVSRLPGQQEQAQRQSELRYPSVTVEPATARATPDAQTELLLGITNRSDTVNEFTVELDDPSVGWIRIEPPSRNIWPGSRDTFRIIIQPPRSTAVRAGWKEYGLRILSDGIPEGVTTASIRIEVLPFEAVEARLIPRNSSGFRKGRHRVELKNMGSAPWTASLAATDPDDVLRFQVPKQVMALPGETLNVPVAVQPKGLTFIGSSSKHEFSVALQREGGTPITVGGNFEQRAFIPAKLIPPLLVVAAAAVAVALFAGGVLPPKADSTPAPSVAVVTSEAPSVPVPSVSAAVSEAPSVEVSTPPSDTPSVDPSVAPEGVDQWAWDRKLRLLTQGNPFDVGKPIGGTQDTSDGRARVQWFEQAVMYQFQDQSLQVVRPPILAGFPLQPISKDPPSTGYPTDARKGAGGNLVYQVFETDTIMCADTSCVVYPMNVFREWLTDKDRLGSPTGGGTSAGGAMTVYPFEQGHIVWDPTRFFVSACDANNVYISGDTDLCSAP
jgi:hypothetical protein